MAQNTLGRNITFPIYNADGTAFHGLELKKATVDSVVMSLGDKVTGDVYYIDNTLAVTMQEYIVVNGVKYTLVSPPTIVREGMVADNAQLKGMTKYSFTFYHPMYQLGNIPFTDVAVTQDQEKYLSQNKTFSWIGNLFEFVQKLKANLKNTQWTVEAKIPQYEQDGETITPQWQKALKQSDVLSFDKNFISDALKTAYDTWEIPFVISDYGSVLPSGYTLLKWVRISEIHQSVTNTTAPFWLFIYNLNAVSADDKKIHYCKVFKEDTLLFDLVPCKDSNDNVGLFDVVEGVFYGSNQEVTFVAGDEIGKNKKFNITFGLPTNNIYDENGNEYVFRFGKGLGLKNNSRTPRNNKIVTRIVGYGSDRNIPYGYPQIVWDGNQSWNYTINNAEGMQPIEIGGQTIMAMSYPIYDGIVGGQKVRLIKHPFTRTTLMPSIYSETVNKKVNPNATGYDPDIEIKDYYDAIDDATHAYPNYINVLAPSVEIHQFEKEYPQLGEAAIISATPYDEDGEYYTYTQWYNYLQTRIATMRGQGIDGWQLQLIVSMRDNTCHYTPETAESLPSASIPAGHWEWRTGQATATLDSVIKGNFVYVTLVSSWYNETHKILQIHADPTPVWDDTYDYDNDKYVQGCFKIKLPQLSFDLYACAAVTQEMNINMRSGSCMGCTFPVQVDWELYKANFYDSNGNFAPDGAQRDLEKFPKSNLGSIDVIVKKDNDTFGTLMPNQYRYPVNGDKFVILGISLPTSYITTAEQSLDEAMKEYMLENNVHYYDYPLKFDEHFLATHQNILAQIKNNNVVKFQYAGTQMSLYIKQITIKYGDKPLPQYDITLTDDVEIVLNQIGQVTDDVSRMRVQVSELQKYYSENLIQEINSKLSKVVDDVCQGRITFQQGLDALDSVIFHDKIQSPQFEEGLYTGRGWRIDNLGNAEFESARVRSFLEIVELIVNRLQAQEGDTLFTDNDQIEKVDPVYEQATPEQGDNPKANKWYERTRVNNEYVYTPTNDTQVDQQKTYYYISSYILSLKEKYEGYVTGQMYNNVVKGIVNTLAAKQAGVSDYESTSVEVDGENKYYTSWMRVIGTHNTNINLGVNQIQVVLYSDDYYDDGHQGDPEHLHHFTPAGRNFAPCELMTIARWGCVDYSDPEDPDYESIKASIIRRQRMFMISTTDGRVVKYTGVDSPILNNGNYGVTIGELPEFVKNYPDVRAILNQVGEHTDWLYAQGIVVGNFIKVDIEGRPEVNIIDCGEWVNGSSTANPTPRNGIYLYDEWNNTTQQYETHDVWHNNAKWRCLQHQPVVIGGVSTYYEPTDANSSYWRKLEQGSSGGETIMQYALSAYKTSSDGTAQTPPADISSLDWQDSPMATTSQKPYLWSKVQKKDGNGNIVGSATYIRLTGELGIDYEIRSTRDSVKIASDETTATCNATLSFYQKESGKTPVAYNCHYACYSRTGQTYTLFQNSSSKTSSATINPEVSAAVDAIAIFIFDSAYNGSRPTSQNYLAKKEILVEKNGNTGSVAVQHYIKTDIDNVVIPSDVDSTTLSSVPKAYFRKITGNSDSSQSMYWGYCWRTGSSYTTMQTGQPTDEINLPQTYSSTYDALVVFARMTGSVSTTNYDAKKEIIIQKRGSNGKDARYIHLKGTCMNNNQPALCEVYNGTSLDSRTVTSRGLTIYKINRSTLAITLVGNYDVYGDSVASGETACQHFAQDLDAITSDYFVCIVSYDAVRWTSEMIQTLTEFGSLGVNDTTAYRVPFAFIGQKGLAQGQAMQVQGGSGTTDPPAEIVVYVNNGVMATSKEPTVGKLGGRFYYNAGEFTYSLSISFYVTPSEAPYFLYNNEYWVFEPNVSSGTATYTTADMGYPSSTSSNWHLMFYNKQKFLMSDVMFAKYAHLGSFIFNGDWMISTNGKIDGSAYNNNANIGGQIYCAGTMAQFSVKGYTLFNNTNPLGETQVISERGTGSAISLAYDETRHTIYYGYFKKDKTYKFTCTGNRNDSSYPVYVRIRRSSNDEVSTPTMYPSTSDYTSDWGTFRVVADGYYYIEMYQESTGSGHGGETSDWKLTEISFRPNLALDGMTGATYQQNAYISGTIYAQNGEFNGVVKANLMYSPTMWIDGTTTSYTINPSTAPYHTYYITCGNSNTTITLPDATTCDGLELRFFFALITRTAGGPYLYSSDGIYKEGSRGTLELVTSLKLTVNKFVIVMSMQGYWYVVS